MKNRFASQNFKPKLMTPSKRCSLSCESLKSWIATLAILEAFLCNGMIISIANISDEVVVTPNPSKSLKDIPITYYGILFGIFKLTVFGKNLSSFGVRKVFLGGLVMTGSMTIIFGLLTQTKFNCLLPGETWQRSAPRLYRGGSVLPVRGDLVCHGADISRRRGAPGCS